MSQRRRKYRYSRQPRITSYTFDIEVVAPGFHVATAKANWTGYVGQRRAPKVQLTGWTESRTVGYGTNLQQIPKERP